MIRFDHAVPALARLLLLLVLAPAPSTLAAQSRPDSARTDSTRAAALDAVVVSATRTEQSLNSLPTHVIVLDATRIAESPAQGVPELLRSIPGFSTRVKVLAGAPLGCRERTSVNISSLPSGEKCPTLVSCCVAAS